MALPVWLATHDVILAYNVVFLASMALSGLGMFLLVRELTGSAVAAFLAGLAFAFLPYRLSQIPHVQVMSSEWMPWTIYAFRRYFATRRPAAVAGALAALLAQQLACGYFLIYFTPFVAFYLAWEVTARAQWRDRRLVGTLVAAAADRRGDRLAVPVPVLELRRLGFPPRARARGIFGGRLGLRHGAAGEPVMGILAGPDAVAACGKLELFAGAPSVPCCRRGVRRYAGCDGVSPRNRGDHRGSTDGPPGRGRLRLVRRPGGDRLGRRPLRAGSASDADHLVIALAMSAAGLLVLSPRLRAVVRSRPTFGLGAGGRRDCMDAVARAHAEAMAAGWTSPDPIYFSSSTCPGSTASECRPAWRCWSVRPGRAGRMRNS
jgi:hypothetical protein